MLRPSAKDLAGLTITSPRVDGPGARAYLGAVNRRLLSAFAAVCCALVAGAAAVAAPPSLTNVQAQLVSSRAAIAPGETFTVALRQSIRPGWHTYWRNPGDSGIPTSLKWSLPKGFTAGEIEWPAPREIKVETLVNYGYEGEVLLPVELTAPKDAAGVAHLTAHALWLVCADICIPEETDLALDMPLRAQGADDPVWAPKLAAARAAIPKPAPIDASLVKRGNAWALDLAGGPLAPLLSARAIRAPAFFPFAGDAIDHAAPQKPRVAVDGVELMLTAAPNSDLGAGPLVGVVTFEKKTEAGWTPAGYQISAKPAAASAADGSGATSLGLIAALGFALLGGVILNLMPCVFPVLSMKALALARTDPHEARRHGAFFLGGVMATFIALAGLLIALQAAGAEIGWGFQLQEPLVVAALGLLFFAIALNLLGAYEIGGTAQGLGAGLASRGGDAGAFFTGALAVVAATPCTAPFMGAALGFAATQPALISLGVFAALGLGFALPFVLIGTAPPLRRLIPKPGPWMDAFKQFLAFPMFAAAIWLVWVLTQQAGANGLLAMLAAFLGFGFAVWAVRRLKNRVSRWTAIVAGVVVILGAGVGVAHAVATGAAVAARPGTLAAELWSPARVADLRAAGTPVFVDFTAAWCVTCQVNEQVALDTPDVARAFAKRGIVYLRADWTKRDGEIAAALKEHGRVGVPLYLFYPAGASAPKILPQLLTPGIVLDAVGQGG